MQVRALISTRDRLKSARLVSPSRFCKLSYPQNLCRKQHHSSTKKRVDFRQPAPLRASSALRPISGSTIHDVKVGSGKLDSESCPQRTSSSKNTDMYPQHVEQGLSQQHTTTHRAMISLGSNIGDRVSMIEQACEKMLACGIYVKATSLLYETAPMYVTDQDMFYNGVCEVRSCHLVKVKC